MQGYSVSIGWDEENLVAVVGPEWKYKWDLKFGTEKVTNMWAL